MREEWTEKDWNDLLLSIKLKHCTPFIGSGAAADVLPTGRKLAEAWADEFEYPFADRTNLLKVAQYVAVNRGGRMPQLKIVEQFSSGKSPDFSQPDEPHRAMAELRLPLYITTNYDSFMYQALQLVNPPEKVSRAVCQWYLAGGTKKPKKVKVNATPESPLVYHLHGVLDVTDSIVITEDDYLDFLMYISEDPDLIPPQIQQVFRNSSLLFLGYSLDDTDFKLILRRMAGYLHRGEGPRHVAVQIAPTPPNEEPSKEDIERATNQQNYLQEHYKLQKVKVLWRTCRKFAAELAERWRVYPK